MPRFVILEHDHPELHWDLMLETGAVLRTWRLAQAPGTTMEPIAATASGDHRLFYLDYEGPVSGGRGKVVRWDAGTYEQKSADERTLQVFLSGTKVTGNARLERAADMVWRFSILGDT